jgi:uncharacterized protein (TIGR03083 family)
MLDTRHFFRPLIIQFANALQSLSEEQWLRSTSSPRWRVRDVVAHLIDTALRRVSIQRDHHQPPQPSGHVSLVTFVNSLNAEWVGAMDRLSPRVLTDLYARAGADLANWMERLPLDGPPLFPVSWAGPDGNQGWLDIGRDFTEQWHHQMQVGEAVGIALDGPPEWLHAVLEVALHGLPHAYQEVEAAEGTTIGFLITGLSGGEWSLRRQPTCWHLSQGHSSGPDVLVRVSQDAAWRLLFNGLTQAQAREAISVEGPEDLAKPFLDARSVIV